MNIVLVHGILGFGHVGPINYFNGVADHFRLKFGASVHAPALDPTAGTGLRSAMLRRSIEDALAQRILDPAQPIHIIAHSMGGLDARRMISQDPTIAAGEARVSVKTLATIGTPHRGSSVADVVAGEFVPRLPLLAPLLLAAKMNLGNVLEHFRISLEGLHDLTTKAAADFNTHVLDSPAVTYSSYAGGGRTGFVAASGTFLPYHEFIRVCDGEANDGVVAVSSARWTGFDPNLWPTDHADEVGHNLDDPLQALSQETRDRYDSIVARF